MRPDVTVGQLKEAIKKYTTKQLNELFASPDDQKVKNAQKLAVQAAIKAKELELIQQKNLVRNIR